MKVWNADYGGGMDSVRLAEVETPELGPKDVLVRTRWASLNRRELFILAGRYPLPVKPTLVLGCDGAGDVVEVGREVTTLKVGNRVVSAVFTDWSDGDFSMEVTSQLGGALDGTLAEYVRVPERAAVQIPEDMTYEVAATLPCAGVTAWHAVANCHLAASSKILTTTSGAVSLFALGIARAHGYEVVVSTRATDLNDDLLRLGASHVIDSEQEPSAKVMELTSGRGVDLVIHNYGSIDESVQAARVAGQVNVVTVAGGTPIDPIAAFARNVTINPISLGSIQQTRQFVEFAATHEISVPVADIFGFDDVKKALTRYEAERSFGKILIAMD